MSTDPPEVSTGELKLRTYTRDDATVVECTGKLIAEHSNSLKSHVQSIIPHAKRIILDLNAVTRMDSAGLGAVVGLYASARKAKCDFLLINYSKPVRDLLGLTNLLSVFEACAQTGTRFP
jgi:anti-anti-sigma factor